MAPVRHTRRARQIYADYEKSAIFDKYLIGPRKFYEITTYDVVNASNRKSYNMVYLTVPFPTTLNIIIVYYATEAAHITLQTYKIKHKA